MVTMDVQDAALQRVLRQLQERGQNITRVLVPVVGDSTKRVLRFAKDKTPIAEASLRRSGWAKAEALGQAVRGQVTFGGLAAAYAEVQHENESFRHTLPPGVSRTHTTRLYRNGRGQLRPRKRKHPLKGYRGGQAHFLTGAPNSAWDAQEQALLKEALLEAATEELQFALMGGTGD